METKNTRYSVVPVRQDQLAAKADLVVVGLTKHQSAIGVKQNSAAAVKADLAAYRKIDGQFRALRDDQKKKLTPEQGKVDLLARDLIKGTKEMVGREFGDSWNDSWTQVGYLSPTLSMPRHLDERETLVERIANFLTTNPRFENEKTGVTAEKASEIHRRFLAARSATKERKSTTRNLSGERQAAETKLRKRLSGLVSELKQLLPEDDSRWLAFGITPPADRRAALKANREAKRLASAANAAPEARAASESDPESESERAAATASTKQPAASSNGHTPLNS